MTVGIIFGGRSAEHEVSIQSAKNILHALDRSLYIPFLIGIDKQGGWHFGTTAKKVLNTTFLEISNLGASTIASSQDTENDRITTIPASNELAAVDVFFPVLHGPYGEDGTVQGLLKIHGKPYVGSGVLGSAIGMDKDVMKRLLAQAHIPIVNYKVFRKYERESLSYKKVAKDLGETFFVKPANLGSSIGVYKVSNSDEFESAVEDAYRYDTKIIIEEFIEAREIECSVLGNDVQVASIPGEITPTHEFYSYESKYIDTDGASITIPAKLSPKKIAEIQMLASKVFTTLCAEGLARVDFFMDKKSEKIYVNEINTMPGFTNISMYPKLWEESGITYKYLISKLLILAIEKFNSQKSLKTTR